MKLAACLALLLAAGPLAAQAEPTPRELVPFLHAVVARRAEEGLARIVADPADARHGTIYGGRPEDANIAWVAAGAYKDAAGRLHNDAAVRDAAFGLLDALAERHATGDWDDGGLDAYFGVQSFGWAVLEWSETGEVAPERLAAWTAAVAAAADSAMALHHGSTRAGDYANPEFYYLAGLAAAWKLTGDERYRDEAAAALRRYDDSLYPGGGMAYFHHIAPEHGYQQMVVKGTVLYWDLTRDPLALDYLRRMAPYFVDVQHRSGLLTDAEHPWLKHGLYSPVNPAVPAVLAAILDDPQNRHVADVAARGRADNIDERLPSFLEANPNWYNYHHATYAAMALRVLAEHELPEPEPPAERRVLLDGGFAGVRSHWDDFTAASTTRRASDSLAGAYLADPAEPMHPLGAALDGVFFEVLNGDRGPDASESERHRARFRNIDWTPLTHVTTADGFAAASVLSPLTSPVWGDLPWLPGERWRLDEVSDWTTLQHWAVWRDRLIGLGALHCHGDGGDPATADVARVLWRLAPQNREFEELARGDDAWAFRYGGLEVRLSRLAEKGGFAFDTAPLDDAAHWRDPAPVLARPAPWQTGDFVHVATVAGPADSEGEVAVKPLNEGAAAAMVEPDGRRAYVWVVSLVRHWRHHELAIPDGASVTVYRGEHPMPPVPPGGPAVAALMPGQSAVMVIDAPGGLEAQALLDGLSSSWGRGEQRPQR